MPGGRPVTSNAGDAACSANCATGLYSDGVEIDGRETLAFCFSGLVPVRTGSSDPGVCMCGHAIRHRCPAVTVVSAACLQHQCGEPAVRSSAWLSPPDLKHTDCLPASREFDGRETLAFCFPRPLSVRTGSSDPGVPCGFACNTNAGSPPSGHRHG